MEPTEHFFSASRKALEEYIADRLLLLKMQAAEKTARIVAVLFTALVMALLFFFILLFLSIMAGYYFSDLTGSLYIGFALVTGLYLLLLGVLFFTRKYYEKWIINTLIRVFFDKPEGEDAANDQ